MSNSVFLGDDSATVAFGKSLAKACNGRGLITLSGDLGSGKTTLSRGLIQAYGHKGAVKSPTYTLVEPYEIGDIHVYHFDLYRMEDPEELEFIGFWDYLNEKALVLIEWPEKAAGVLPAIDLALTLSIKNQGRTISWQGQSAFGEEISDKLTASL